MLGRFNPLIISPQWLGKFKILPSQDIQWAEGELPEIKEIKTKTEKIVFKKAPKILVTNEISELNFPDIRILTLDNRFQCSSTIRGSFTKIVETTVRIFELLNHTPITGVGINFDSHLRFAEDSKDKLNNLFGGQTELLKSIYGNDFSLEGTIISDFDGTKLSTTIQKSKKLEGGLLIKFNYHRDLASDEAGEATDWIRSKYQVFVKKTTNIIPKLFGKYTEIWTPQPH